MDKCYICGFDENNKPRGSNNYVFLHKTDNKPICSECQEEVAQALREFEPDVEFNEYGNL